MIRPLVCPRPPLAGLALLAVVLATSSAGAQERPSRAFTLDNGIEVFLTQDPAADHSSAALAVEAGSIQDGDTAGIAHFLEHMLFLGTKKYPDPGAYSDYLAANDGQSNAYTAFEHTNYHFEVKNEAFEGALDRFSRFFIDPLITDALSAREVNAVDSEHSKNLQDEYWRARQVFRSLLNPKHPASGFSTGDKQTLAGVKNERMWAFYREHYSANLMHLAIVTRHPLDVVEAWVREKFSPIENRRLTAPVVTEKIFSDTIAGKRVDIQSLTQYEKLWVRFELPPEVFDHESKPTHLLSAILGHEGKESLLQQLKSEGLATTLSTSPERVGVQGLFDMTLSLTPKGLTEIDTVLERIFGMINHLRGLKELPAYLFREEQEMAALQLRFRRPESAFDEARWFAGLMVELPHEHLLESQYLLKRYDAALVRKVLDALVPENAAILVIAKDRVADQKEKHYGTGYAVRPLGAELLERLHRAAPTGAMGVPAENPFIPTDFAMVEPTTATQPTKQTTDFGEVWLRHDDRFKQPRAALRLRIGNDENRKSAHEYVLGLLFAEAANLAINPHRYPMTQAGMDLGFASEREGLILNAEGFSHKLPDLIAFAAPYLKEVRIDASQFEIIRNDQIRLLKNKSRQPPSQAAFEVFREILREIHFTDAQQLEELGKVTFADLSAYAERARKEIWIEGFVYGNLTAARVQEMTAGVVTALAPARALAPEERYQRRVFQLAPGTSCTVRRPVESNDSVTLLFYQHDVFTPESKAAFQVLRQVMPNRFYQDLRTLQQTGYIVNAGGMDLEGFPVFYFLSQSSVVAPTALLGRFEAFLRHLAPDLAALTPEEFEASKQSALSELTSRRKDFAEELAWNFQIAFGQFADFGFVEREAKDITALTQERWLEWAAKFFAEDKARRVSIELAGSAERRSFPEHTVEELRAGGGAYWKRPAPEAR